MFHPDHGIDMRAVFEKYFELCAVKAGEHAVILSSASSPGLPGPWAYRTEYVKAAGEALAALGATSFHMELPAVPKPWLPLGGEAPGAALTPGMGTTSLETLPVAVDTLRQADFVVDLTFTLFSKELDRILEAGTRLTMVLEPPEALVRLFPSPALKEALTRGKEMWDQGPTRTLRVHSKHGTDMSMAIGELTAFFECGYADEPGTWDAFPSGQMACCPDDGSSNGTIVVAPGDQIVLPYMRYVDSPVTLHVEDGYIRDIDGGTDARLIREHMENWHDPEVYAIGHQSIGLHPNARWDALATYGHDGMGMDGRIMKGGYILGTGPNTANGGTRNTPCHFDILMRDCTIELDGRKLVDAGTIVAEELDVSRDEVGFH